MTSATEFLRNLADIIAEFGADTETRMQVTLTMCIAGLDKHADGAKPSAHEPKPAPNPTRVREHLPFTTPDNRDVPAYRREQHFKRGSMEIVRLYHVNEYGLSEWLYYHDNGGEREAFAEMTYNPESDKFDISIYWDNTIIKKQYSVFDTAEMCVLVWGFDEQ